MSLKNISGQSLSYIFKLKACLHKFIRKSIRHNKQFQINHFKTYSLIKLNII